MSCVGFALLSYLSVNDEVQECSDMMIYKGTLQPANYITNVVLLPVNLQYTVANVRRWLGKA